MPNVFLSNESVWNQLYREVMLKCNKSIVVAYGYGRLSFYMFIRDEFFPPG